MPRPVVRLLGVVPGPIRGGQIGGQEASAPRQNIAAPRPCVVGYAAVVGELIPFAELVRMRRQRVARAVHARCRMLIAASIDAARIELVTAPVSERRIRVARLRKLEQLEQYADMLG